MATPFDQIGGLLGMDPEQLRTLMAQFSPSDDDRKAAKMSGIAQLGLGLLGARKGREWDQAGAAGQNALAARDASLQGSQAAKMQQFQMAEHFAKLNAGQQEAKRKQALNQDIGSLFNPGNPTQGMESRAPTMDNAAKAPAPRAKWETYLQAAELAAQGGDMEAAKHWAGLAEKHKPKYSTTPQVVRGADGKLQLAQFSDDGGTKTAEGMTPAEKLHFANTGGMAGVGMDPYSGAQVSQGMPVTMDPAQMDASKRGWAQYQLSANADKRAADAAKGGPGGESWTNDLERGIQINPKTGESRPIMAAGAPIGAKGASKQAEQSKTALTIIGEAEKLLDKSTGSYLGAGVDAGARVFGMSTPGAEASGQLQALEGALMLNQPRMEGPQSDRDTALYKQMAAKIGDPTIPNGIKKAAIATVKALHKKYANPAAQTTNADPLGLR